MCVIAGPSKDTIFGVFCSPNSILFGKVRCIFGLLMLPQTVKPNQVTGGNLKMIVIIVEINKKHSMPKKLSMNGNSLSVSGFQYKRS